MSLCRYNGPPFLCDYAPTGRAGCRECKEKLPKLSLRIAKVVPNPFSQSGGWMNWYHHPGCIFKLFARSGPSAVVIERVEDIGGHEKLSPADHHLIRCLISETMSKRASGNGEMKLKKAKHRKRPAADPVNAPCPICRVPVLRDESDAAALHCGHTCHYACFKQWLRQKHCPTCHQQIDRDQIIQLHHDKVKKMKLDLPKGNSFENPSWNGTGITTPNPYQDAVRMYSRNQQQAAMTVQPVTSQRSDTSSKQHPRQDKILMAGHSQTQRQSHASSDRLQEQQKSFKTVQSQSPQQLHALFYPSQKQKQQQAARHVPSHTQRQSYASQGNATSVSSLQELKASLSQSLRYLEERLGL